MHAISVACPTSLLNSPGCALLHIFPIISEEIRILVPIRRRRFAALSLAREDIWLMDLSTSSSPVSKV